ncbi:MAG: hypothetical protein K0S39_4117 [Paenibacillus sp.]|jgi:hypothetical protein|nr:hypothetical protein [Paenibacillus sp.]
MPMKEHSVTMVRAHRCILRMGLKEFTPDLLHRLVDKIDTL